MNQPQPDPVVDEIREVRFRISAQFDHDPAKLVAHYLHLQEGYRDRLLGAPKSGEFGDKSAA
jgi:hypothetical protein